MFDQRYREVSDRILAICEGETDAVSLMATVSCELFHSFVQFHWVGFYRVVTDDLLKVGPYQGGHGCLVIPFSRGVCGACASARETIIVDDVEAFEDHIACSSTTRSEIVLPVFGLEGRLIAVLDIDSDDPAAFDQADAKNLEYLLAEVFAKAS